MLSSHLPTQPRESDEYRQLQPGLQVSELNQSPDHRAAKQERKSRPLLFSTFFKNGIISNIFCTGELWIVSVFQLYLTFWDPIDCSLPGSSVHGILQARILEWVSTPFSKEAFPAQGSNPGLPHCRQILYHLSQ